MIHCSSDMISVEYHIIHTIASAERDSYLHLQRHYSGQKNGKGGGMIAGVFGLVVIGIDPFSFCGGW